MHIFNGATLTAFLNLKPEKRTEIKEIQISQIFTKGSLKIQILSSLMEALSTCTNLEIIILNENKMGKWSNERLKILGAGLLNISTLKAIHLEGNQLNELSTLGIQILFGFLSLSAAQELYLQGNDLGKSNVSCLIELGRTCAQFKYLKILHLGHNNFDESSIPSVQAFFDTLARSSVEELNLEANGLGNFKLATPCLAALGQACAKFKHLCVLSLARNRLNQLQDPAFNALTVGIRQCNTLREIEGIQSFTASHQQVLNDILIRNEQRLIKQKIQQALPLPYEIKTLIFSYYDPQLPEDLFPLCFQKLLMIFLMLKDLKQDKSVYAIDNPRS